MEFGIALGLTIGMAFIAINTFVLNLRRKGRKW
jgi:hypothetical protein